MNTHSDKKLDVQAAPSFLLDEAKHLQLNAFLTEVANTPLKVKILFFFLCQPTSCMSSCYLGERMGESELMTRTAAKELAERGAFSYCPYFAYTDLCHLALATYSPEIQENMALLLKTLRFAPELVWDQFASA